MIRWACVLGLLSCSLASGAAAQPDPYAIEQPSGKIAAETLFQEAALLMNEGDYQAACPKLEASEALDMAVGTLLYLGDCYEHSGRLASAWARFSEARSLARAQNMPERERIAAERVAALEPRMPRVTLVVPGATPPGFSLRLAGARVPAASFGSALPIDAGEVEVEAAAPGYEAFGTRLHVPDEVGARVNLVIPALQPQLQALSFGAAARPRSPAAWPRLERVDAGKTWRTVGLTIVGVGAVGLIGGGVATALAIRSNDESKRECGSDQRLCTQRGVTLRDRAALQADVATVSVAAGGTLVLTGLLAYAFPGSKQREVRVAFQPTSRGALVGVRGGF